MRAAPTLPSTPCTLRWLSISQGPLLAVTLHHASGTRLCRPPRGPAVQPTVHLAGLCSGLREAAHRGPVMGRRAERAQLPQMRQSGPAGGAWKAACIPPATPPHATLEAPRALAGGARKVGLPLKAAPERWGCPMGLGAPGPGTGTHAGPVPSGATNLGFSQHPLQPWLALQVGCGGLPGGPVSSPMGAVPRHQRSRLWRERATCHLPQEQAWPKVTEWVTGEPRQGSPGTASSLGTPARLGTSRPHRRLGTRPRTAGLLPLGRSASLPLGPRQGLQQHVPRMRGPSAAQVGALGRPWVLLLTYVLASVEFSCLFMQFSVLPVSAAQAARPTGPLSPSQCPPVPGQGRGWEPDAAGPSCWEALATLQLSEGPRDCAS